MLKYIKSVRIEEWLVFASAAVIMFINISVYRNNFSFFESSLWMFKYFSFGTPFLTVFFFFIWMFCFWKLYIGLVRIAQDIFIERKAISLKERSKKLLMEIFASWRTLVPFVFVSFAFYQLLANFSYQLRFNTADVFLIGLDRKLLGVYPFVWLPTFFNQEWFSHLMYFIYIYIGIPLGGTLILLFLFSRDFLFRRVVLAFTIMFVIAYPIFYFLPCQDPSNYFLRNIRGRSFSPETISMLQEYAPNALTSGYINRIAEAETNVSRDNTVPISCFPSMHAAWSFMIVYFLAKLRRRSLFVSLPWLALLLLSGVYFAQHYAVDYLIAFVVVATSLFLANLLIRQRSAVADNVFI